MKKNEKAETLTNMAIEGASYETVQRYGSAVKEHVVAYSGKDNATGMQLKKGLKDIGKEKINPDYRDRNIKQQSGYAAENKYTARQNAERIINGKKSRVYNTDTKGSGNYNRLYDHIIKDKNGNIISKEQMKFVGSSPKECLSILAKKEFQKYLDADATITVPSDYYDGIIQEADKQIELLKKQFKKVEGEKKKEISEKIKKYKKIRKNVKNSGVSTTEAKEARLHPKLSTAKDIGKIAHKAGLEQAKYGAVVGGSISIVRNLVAVVKGEKEPMEAGEEIAKDTGTAVVSSYATAFSGAVIKGGMQNSASTAVRTLAKTNLAATIVTSTVEMGKTLKKYITGTITGLECLEELGEKGTGQLSAAMFAVVGHVVGQAVIPIPGVGAMIGSIVGSIVGYALSSACYGELVGALKEAEFAHSERIRIEKECEESIKMIIQFREEMNESINHYLKDINFSFQGVIEQAEKGIWRSNINEFIENANAMCVKLGKNPQFRNRGEFDMLMESEETFRL